jgi:hypothetical protein
MKKIDISIVPSESGGTYPRPFAHTVTERRTH